MNNSSSTCSEYTQSMHEIFPLGLKEALEERKTLIDERLRCCIEKKIPPVQDAVHEVKAMAAKLRARAEAVKSEICATAEECVKRIISRKQEMLARVNILITFRFVCDTETKTQSCPLYKHQIQL